MPLNSVSLSQFLMKTEDEARSTSRMLERRSSVSRMSATVLPQPRESAAGWWHF